jgi:hypothetical protein
MKTLRKYYVRFAIFTTASLLLAAYACDGGTGPGDGGDGINISGYIYIFNVYSGNDCIKKLKANDGSVIFTTDTEPYWLMYDMAVNPFNGDFYAYYGTDIVRYSKDGALLSTFNDVTVNTIGDKLECALSGDNKYIWIIKDNGTLDCLNSLSGNRVTHVNGEAIDAQSGPGSKVWALGYFDGSVNLALYDIDGQPDVVISEPDYEAEAFTVNTSDYSVWVFYDNNKFIHYDYSGVKLGSFSANLNQNERPIELRVNRETGDILFLTTERVIGFNANGTIKYIITSQDVTNICFAPDDTVWFAVRAKENKSDCRLETRDIETGELLAEVKIGIEYVYLVPANR